MGGYARFVDHWDVTMLPYDGEADRWFDPAWLLAGGSRTDRAGTMPAAGGVTAVP
ncbi:Dihydromethanopterin reductase [Methylobrevis pamukkalensis]|uniref:Dihydromethanopterin reductase n=1 Tax=Methylobrevis pamukkalensis TaxID=1439726 RepID=A0A1E3GXE6_9HYPH|nr:Dihydromethanopterin reductase [Methylobrevis pamukkalensis]